MQEDLFDRVHIALGGKDKAYKTISNCPFCDDSNSHFAYSQAGWYKCVRCQAHGNLRQLAQHLRLIDATDYVPQRIVERPKPSPVPVARWRLNPDKLLDGYRRHPRRFELWAGYKPVSRAAIERFDLGVGRLPFYDNKKEQWYMSKSEWLTVPVYEGDELVAIRGRNLGSKGPKWISSTGSQYTLFNVDAVRCGSVCWLLENIIDAIWLMDTYPDWDAVSTGGVSWRSQWAEWLAARRPEVVIVALDRDLPGQATGEFRRQLEAEWRREHPGTKPPTANGPKIANNLRRLGQQAILFEWPDWAPHKADIGWVLQQERKAAA